MRGSCLPKPDRSSPVLTSPRVGTSLPRTTPGVRPSPGKAFTIKPLPQPCPIPRPSPRSHYPEVITDNTSVTDPSSAIDNGTPCKLNGTTHTGRSAKYGVSILFLLRVYMVLSRESGVGCMKRVPLSASSFSDVEVEIVSRFLSSPLGTSKILMSSLAGFPGILYRKKNFSHLFF